MKTKTSLILFGIILLTLNTFGIIWIHRDLIKYRDTVLIHSANWSPDNINPDRIKVIFDRNIVSPEQIGQTIGNLLKIEPALPGKWMWQAPNTAEYLLESPVGPGRQFSLMPSDQFFTLTAMRLSLDQDLYLKTLLLNCVQARIIASDNKEVTVEIEFNQPVDPSDLLRHITFYDAALPEKREIANVQALTSSASNKIVLRLQQPSSDSLEIVVNKDLKGYQADLTLGKAFVQQLKVSQKFMFMRSSAYTSRFESTASVNLEFSQQLDKDQDIPQISVSPEVINLKISRNYKELILTGAFEPAKKYTIQIPSILSSDKNQTLGNGIQVTVDIPDRDSGIQFVYSGGILSPQGQKTLDMKAVNVSDLELTSWRVFENNLVSYLDRNSRDRTSQYVLKKTLKLDLPRNKISEFAVELNDLIKPGPGIYYVSATDAQNYWESDSTMVLLSDLAITAKMSHKGAMVWITSISQGIPVQGAVIKGLSYQNQVLTQAITDKDGIAKLNYASTSPNSGKIWLITAKLDNDLNYIKPADNQWVLDDVDQSGRSWPQSLETMLYTERGVYRPGDTIHLTGIVRDKDGKVPPTMPFTLKVLRPDGKEIENTVVKPIDNGQGFFHKSILTANEFQTGIYTFQTMLPGSEVVLGTTQASVEAFIPLRMRVVTQNTKDRYDPNETPSIQVSGRYLWDQATSDMPLKVNCTLEAKQFQSNEYRNYQFGLPNHIRSISLPEIALNLDKQGQATVDIPLSDSLEAALYKLYITATLTEPGARSVSSNTSTLVDRLNHHIGLKSLADQIIAPNEPLNIDWVSLTGKGESFITDQISYELFSVEYNTVLKMVNDKRVWQSEEKLTKVKNEEIQNQNSYKGLFSIVCPDSGYYRLIVKDAKTKSATQLDFYASAYASKHSLEMNQPERLEMITDKQEYLPGDTVDVLIRSPISGKAFVTIETDQVLHYQFVDVKENSAEIKLPLIETVRGSAYISATVIRRVDPNQKDWLPHRALGMSRIRINHKKNQLPIKITAPDKTEPDQTITVAVRPEIPVDPNHPTMVHLWAVDEGILLASDYKTPNPFDYFLSPRKPGVFSSDLYQRLMPDYERPESMIRIGADGSEIFLLRRNPVPTRYRKPNVIWNQVLPVDNNGNIQVEMKLPDLMGQLRLMAVAVSQNQYGKTDKPLILSKDLIVESSCPRFAAPGDTFIIPVKIFNNKTEPVDVKLHINIDGPLQVKMPTSPKYSIEAQKNLSVMLEAEALEIGLVDIAVSAEQINPTTSPTLIAKSSAHFPVRPSTALHSEIRFNTIDAGQSLTISPSDSFIAGTEQLNLKIYSKPTIQMAPALEKLIGYPYGCVEQTTSRLLGLLNAHEILDPARAESLKDMVQAGIARLWGMQTQSGGLSYWSGGTQPYPWGSAYAGWCLMEAQKAGHKIDTRFSDELIKYLESLLNEATRGDIDCNTKALFCHVLTGFGRSPTGWMNSLAERKDQLDMAGLAHLAAAFHNIGQTQRALDLLLNEDINRAIPTTTSGRLTSQLQQQAVLLSVLLEIDPSRDVIAALVTEINKAQSNGVWQSTLENAAAITALSRYQIQTSHSAPDFTGHILFSNKSPVEFDHKQSYVYQINKLDQEVTITTDGIGKVYIAQSSDGLAKPSLIKPYDKRISVRRIWLNRDEKPINPNQLKVGDLVNVEIELISKDDSDIDNIAIVDALPAGMEVENPRLAGSEYQMEVENPSLVDSKYQYEEETQVRTEFLDDRVILFCSASSEKEVFRYALRVIAAGTFDIPPIQASCMYDPSAASLGTAGKMTVKP